ncbi:hypothetical protein [Hypericibacter sp.]|uniref:hypothetical protein n=1 Tax=Hypericibacter sp. TaxID=2705401 RepID=UPI003D6C9B9F
MTDLVLGLTLKADSSGLVGEVKAAKAELTQLSEAAAKAGGQTDQLGKETDQLGAGLAGLGAATDKFKPKQDGLAAGWTINRIGLMELRAAGVNSFQALAAGMDPLTVASMEAAQVMGALVQGGTLASAGFRSLLATITPFAPLAIAAAAAIAGITLALVLGKNRTDDASAATKAYQDAIKAGTTVEDLYTKAIKAGNEAMLTRQQLLDLNATAQYTTNVQTAQGVVDELQRQLAETYQRQAQLQTYAPGDVQGQRQIQETTAAIQKLEDQLQKARVALINLKSPYIAGGQFAADAEAAAQADADMLKAIRLGHERDDQRLKDEWESQKQAWADRNAFIFNSQLELDQELRKEDEDRKKQFETNAKAWTKALMDEVDAFDQLQKMGAQLTESLLTPQEKYNASLQRYQQLLDAGVISQETFTRAVAAAGKELKSMDPLANLLADSFGQAFDRIGSSITSMSLEGKDAFESLNNLGKAVASELMQTFLKLAVMNPFKNALLGTSEPVLGDILDSLFGGGVPGAGSGSAGIGSAFSTTAGRDLAYGGTYHQGGKVGPGGSGRWVDASVFDGARRMHSGGLVSGERPIIAKDGEEVGWPGQLADKYGSKVQVTVINSTGQQSRTQERQGSDGRREIAVYVGDMMAADIMKGGKLSAALEQTYPLKRGRR